MGVVLNIDESNQSNEWIVFVECVKCDLLACFSLCIVVLCVSVRDNSFSVGLVIADAIADATRADAIGPPPEDRIQVITNV
jgi:hypothetical protein